MKTSFLLHFVVLLSLCTGSTCQTVAQSSNGEFFEQWFERVNHALADQPHWLAPIFTATPRLEEMYVYDISRQDTAKGDVSNFGGTKGLLLIPSEHINLVISPPPYIAHENPKIHDGAGDTTFLMRYRLVAGNEEQGNYIVTAFLSGAVPTGSYHNGAPHSILTPTIGAGKGWGNFDVQSTLGVGIPTGDVTTLGTPVLFNTAFQYRLIRKLWSEVDVNTTFFPNGTREGKKQVFLSPGLLVGRFHLWKRLGFAIGGGVQIAATRFHTYDHNTVLTMRFPF